MKIYLDIDGVLLNKDKTVPEGAVEFLNKIISKHEVFWLTTHCKGDTLSARTYLKAYYPKESHEAIDMIKPTNWDVLKTDSIDFTKDFLWLDDYLMESEKAILGKHNALKNQILVDLRNNPNFFLDLKLKE